MSRTNSRGELIVQAGSISVFHETTDITANDTGAAEDISEDNFKTFCIQVLRTVGGSAFVVNLEGSLQNNNYQILVAHSGTNGAVTFIVDVPVRFARFRVTTVGAGNTLTVRWFGV